MQKPRNQAEPSQIEKFRELARQMEADEDPEAFKATVKRIATAPKPPKGKAR